MPREDYDSDMVPDIPTNVQGYDFSKSVRVNCEEYYPSTGFMSTSDAVRLNRAWARLYTCGPNGEQLQLDQAGSDWRGAGAAHPRIPLWALADTPPAQPPAYTRSSCGCH
ncbi:hypothetical protein DIPPA_12715 [Diplonema papillatum]|nr:hypothetical protein DIPPA_12715 [Diplonema papillatum]